MIYFFLILLSTASLFAREEFNYEDYASISHIPEPLIFDLVRPLGSKKGQWEVNALLNQEHYSDMADSHISPEVEYVFFDDIAGELEFPAIGGDVAALKGVIQWTIGHMGAHQQMVHGLQLIYQHSLETNPYEETTPLYIFGHRLSRNTSYLLMLGDQYRQEHDDIAHRLVFNATIFEVYSHLREIEFGLEQNILGFGRNFEYWRITPQMDVVLSDHLKIQAGFGAIYSYTHGWESTSSLRMVKEFY